MARGPTLFERALRFGRLSELSILTGIPSSDVRTWLRTANYSFLAAPTAKRSEVFVSDRDSILDAYAFDANRMSCSSFETVASIAAVSTMRRSLAWLAIKIYYAAFYSAHALLRFQGVSCTQLDSAETSRLAAVCQAYGFSPGRFISSGFHCLKYDPSSRILSIESTKATGGGSHEIVWREFALGLQRIVDRVNDSTLLTEEKDRISSILAKVVGVLTQAGAVGGNWPSKVRNLITYRHDFGVWYPYQSSNNVDRYLSLIRRNLACDPLESDLESNESLESFAMVCLFVINLTRVSVVDMSSSHGGKSFQDAGPMKVLRTARLGK